MNTTKLLIAFTFLIFVCFHRLYAQSVIEINTNKKFQRIDNFGASSAWNTEFVGRYWSDSEKEKMAVWLFSNQTDKNGNPLGIALSSYRFNIGGGTTELGDSSRLKDFKRRVESFLDTNGNYDWTKQSGYMWFVKKAKAFGVPYLIAFSNTPPVQFTKNGLGFKTVDDHTSNLKEDRYNAYADFLADVVKHFDSAGIKFNYISPVNEPQWSWYNNDQEGSPWTNEEIAHIAKSLDNSLSQKNVDAKILIPEAGDIRYLYSHGKEKAGNQIQSFFDKNSSLYIKDLPHLLNVAGGHSYFSDNGDSARIFIRKQLSDTAAKYETHYWQTEYSELGDGYKENRKGRLSSFDCALFLAKVIHDDLVYGNATAWQFWNSCEPSSVDSETRYNLISLRPANKEFTSGKLFANKNLWILGHYSRFVRSGMYRIQASVNDGLSEVQQAENVMMSAFESKDSIVIVAVNYASEEKNYAVKINGSQIKKQFDCYRTLADSKINLQHSVMQNFGKGISLPAKSVTTFVLYKK